MPVEVRADFERLILSGSRALEFLASQGCTALGNLVLSRRDSLLADVRSTVPVEEVARLRYSPLPEMVSIFSSPLLYLALTKMHAAANNALVRRTLQPPRIPRKLVAGGGSAGSSPTGSAQVSSSGASRPAQKQSSTSSPSGQSGKKRKNHKGKASSSSGSSGRSGGKGKGAGKKSTWQDVSPVESGELPGSALEAVVGNRSGVLGSDRSPGRVTCSLQGLSSSPFSHPGIVSDVPGRLSSGSSLAARGRGDACQRSLRNRPRSGSWLLQSSPPGGEGVWRLVSRDRSLSPERVRPAYSLQDGNSRFCTVICQRGGFSSFPGSERLVLSDPNPSIFEEAIEVHVGGDGLPVSGCRPLPRVFAAVSAWAHTHGIRLLRYLDDWLILASSEREARQAVQLLLSLCRTLRIVINEKKSDLMPSQTAKYLGMTIDSEAGKVFPSGASREIPDGRGELLYHGRSPGSALAGGPRSPGFARAAGPSRSPSDALSAVASQGALVPRVRPSLYSGAFAPGSETGSVLVDGEGSSFDGGSIRDTCSGSSPVFGRVLFGVGRSPPRSTRVRGVVGPGEVAACQSSRDEGAVLGPSVVSRRCHRLLHDSDVRQLDGHGVHQQVRGHGFQGPMLVGQPPSEMDGESLHSSRCEVSSRTSQCPGGYPLPSRASRRDRVVSSSSGGEVTASRLGQSVDRSFCNEPQRETAPLLLARPGSPGRLRGCVSSSLGRPGPVRVPSLFSDRSGDRPCPRVVAGCDDWSHPSSQRRSGSQTFCFY